MSNKYFRSVLCGMIAGAILAYIQLVAYYLVLPYSFEHASWVLGVVVVVGTAVVISAAYVKNSSLMHSLLRLFIIAIFYVISLVLNGYMRTADCFLSFHKEGVSGVSGNVIGLLMLISIMVIFAISFAAIFMKALVCVILRAMKGKTR